MYNNNTIPLNRSILEPFSILERRDEDHTNHLRASGEAYLLDLGQQCKGSLLHSYELWRAIEPAQTKYITKPKIYSFSVLKVNTSVGPAYIMGEGKIAKTVFWACKTPSLKTAKCWFILTGNGTSSSLVHPPAKILYEYRHFLETIYMLINNFKPKGWSNKTGFLNPLSRSCLCVSVIRSAWPLWIGFLNWNSMNNLV